MITGNASGCMQCNGCISYYCYSIICLKSISMPWFKLLILLSASVTIFTAIINGIVAQPKATDLTSGYKLSPSERYTCIVVAIIAGFSSCLSLSLIVYPNKILSLWACLVAFIAQIAVLIEVCIFFSLTKMYSAEYIIETVLADVIFLIFLSFPSFTMYRFWEFLKFNYDDDDPDDVVEESTSDYWMSAKGRNKTQLAALDSALIA